MRYLLLILFVLALAACGGGTTPQQELEQTSAMQAVYDANVVLAQDAIAYSSTMPGDSLAFVQAVQQARGIGADRNKIDQVIGEAEGAVADYCGPCFSILETARG